MKEINGYTLFEAKKDEAYTFVRNDDRGYLSVKKSKEGTWNWFTWSEFPNSDYTETETVITTSAQTSEFKASMDTFCAQLQNEKSEEEIIVENLHSLGFEAVGCHYEREVDDAIVYVNNGIINISNWSVEPWELCRLAKGLKE